MRRHAPLAAVAAALLCGAGAAALADDAPTPSPDDSFDKQYVGRRKIADERVAGGFLGFAKTLHRKKCGDRAKALANHVIIVGSSLQANEAKALIEKIDANPSSGSDADLEKEIREAIDRYKKGYEEVIGWCEKKSFTAELADAKSRLDACAKFQGADPSPPPPSSGSTGEKPSGGGGRGMGGGGGGGGGFGQNGNKGAAGGPVLAEGEDDRLFIERLNFYRKLCGIPEATVDPEISKGAKAHGNYITTNNLQPEDEGGHAFNKEDPSLKGATPEGARTAVNAIFGWCHTEPAIVDEYMSHAYMRIQLLDPKLTKIGLACVRYSHTRRLTILDARSGRSGTASAVVMWPADKATDIPLEQYNGTPDGIPAGEPKQVGYPITLTGLQEQYQGDVSGELLGADGKPVPFHFASPAKPFSGKYPMLDTVWMIPKSPLRPNEKYKATFSWTTASGEQKSRTATFTTGASALKR